jgi:hypothetical protein
MKQSQLESFVKAFIEKHWPNNSWITGDPGRGEAAVVLEMFLAELFSTVEPVPVPDSPASVRGGCGQNGDGSWATDGHGCPICGAYGPGSEHGGGIAGSYGCPNRTIIYDYEGNRVQ